VKTGENSDMIEKNSSISVKTKKNPQSKVIIIIQCVEIVSENHLRGKKVVNVAKKVIQLKILKDMSENLLEQRLNGKNKAIVICGNKILTWSFRKNKSVQILKRRYIWDSNRDWNLRKQREEKFKHGIKRNTNICSAYIAEQRTNRMERSPPLRMEVDPAKKGAVYDNVRLAYIVKRESYYMHVEYICRHIPKSVNNRQSYNSYTILIEKSTENMVNMCGIYEIVGIRGRRENKKVGGTKAKDRYKWYGE